MTYDGSVLTNCGLEGDTFTFYADYSRPPEIDGLSVDHALTYAFYSPFVQAKWDRSVVTIHKGEREDVRDFNILQSTTGP